MTAMHKPDWSKLDADRAKVLAAHREATERTPPGVRLLRGDAVILEAVRWAWPGFLPSGMLTLLGHHPGRKLAGRHALPASGGCAGVER